MKKCVKCTFDKDEEEFVLKQGGTLNSWCKECVRKKAKEKYDNNREQYIERAKQKNLKFRKYLYDYLQKHPCVDCGESDPIVLQFDHRIREEKEYVISNMRMKSFEIIDKEISKCDVRCANCHVRKTAKQMNYYLFDKIE
jgi:hypothetical protein